LGPKWEKAVLDGAHTPPSDTADYSFNKIAKKSQKNSRKIVRFFCDFFATYFHTPKKSQENRNLFSLKIASARKSPGASYFGGALLRPRRFLRRRNFS
jgi:hypothetical protein